MHISSKNFKTFTTPARAFTRRETENPCADIQAKFEEVMNALSPYAAEPRGGIPRAVPETIRVTGTNGASASVTKQTTANGFRFHTLRLYADAWQADADFTGNLIVTRSDNGLYSVYFSNRDTTRLYAEDGSCREMTGDRTNSDAGAILIRTAAGEPVQGGHGNDTFLVYDGLTHINTGEGDNTVIIDGVFNGTLSLGNGDNIITVDTMGAGARIFLGNGNGAFSIRNMAGNSFIRDQRPVPLAARRTFTIGAAKTSASVMLHGGENTLGIGSMKDNSFISQFAGTVELGIGRMNDTSNVFCNAERASVVIRGMSGMAGTAVNGGLAIRVEEMSDSSRLWVSDRVGGLRLPDLAGGSPEPCEPRAGEVFIREMKGTAALSLIGSGHTAAVAALRGCSAIKTEAPEARVIIGEADETAGLPIWNADARVLSELGREELNAVKTMLANWRAEREEAGYPAAEPALWASLAGEKQETAMLAQHMALLMPTWN